LGGRGYAIPKIPARCAWLGPTAPSSILRGSAFALSMANRLGAPGAGAGGPEAASLPIIPGRGLGVLGTVAFMRLRLTRWDENGIGLCGGLSLVIAVLTTLGVEMGTDLVSGCSSCTRSTRNQQLTRLFSREATKSLNFIAPHMA
jgi:hypothetical protein